MTKEELKEHIKQLSLESDLEGIVFELVDNAKEVNAELLNAIADILDLQADFYEKVADILEEEARAYDKLNVELSHIDEDNYNNRLQEISQAQEQLLLNIEKKIEEIKVNQSPVAEPTPTPSMDSQSPASASI